MSKVTVVFVFTKDTKHLSLMKTDNRKWAQVISFAESKVVHLMCIYVFRTGLVST